MRWVDCAPDFETAHFLNGFPTPDGRFRFKPDWAAIGPDHAGMPQLPDHLAVTDESSPEHPWRLVTAPARQFLNTTFTETDTSRQREGRPTARLQPEDCREFVLTAGARVGLERKSGREGKGLYVRVDLRGHRFVNKQKKSI